MKTKIIISIVVLVVMSLFGYWSYRAGLAASQEMNAAFLIPIVKKQHECIDANDIKCIAVTNEVLVSSTAIQVQALMESGMHHTLGPEGEKYLKWAKDTKSTK